MSDFDVDDLDDLDDLPDFDDSDLDAALTTSDDDEIADELDDDLEDLDLDVLGLGDTPEPDDVSDDEDDPDVDAAVETESDDIIPVDPDGDDEPVAPGGGAATALVEDADLLDELEVTPIGVDRDLDVDDEVREGEFVCRSCFMAKRESALADEERQLCRDCV